MIYTLTNGGLGNVTVDQYTVVPGVPLTVPALSPNMVAAQKAGLIGIAVANDGNPAKIANPYGDNLVIPGQTLAGAVGAVVTPDGATVTLNAGQQSGFIVTLNRATSLIANPIGLTAGQKLELVLKQDATGSRLVTWGSQWKFPGGTKPTLTTAANGVDKVAAFFDGTNLYAQAALAFA